MAVLSRRTCGLAVELIATNLSRTDINVFVYKHEVPNELMVGESKAQLVLNIFRSLELRGENDLIYKLVEGALEVLRDEPRAKLHAALLRDGFVPSGEGLLPDEERQKEHKSALEALIPEHGSRLDSTTLLHHLREAEELFRLEKWDASVGQARNFIEQLLHDIADAISESKKATVDLSKPVKVRDYLQSCGFFDPAERKKLVDGVYGYFSEEGSHPGISEQSTARVCLSILWTFGFYVLEKLDDWSF